MRKALAVIATLLCGCSSTSIHTAFMSPVCIKPYKGYKYHTCSDIQFSVNKNKFTIKSGFKTDLASIPKLVWPIMAPHHSSLIRPAIVHDWFYKESDTFTRKETDLIFYNMLVNDGVEKWRAKAMYMAVRLVGWNFYNKGDGDGRFKEMDKKARGIKNTSLQRHC